MRWGRWLVGVVVALAGAGAVTGGFSLAATTEEVFGDLWHPQGSLGIAFAVTGAGLFLAGAWIALAPPSVWLRPWRLIDTPGRLGLTSALLVVTAIAVLAITAQVGGAIMYHPYAWLGLEMLALATLTLLRAGWWVAAAHPPRRR